MWKKLTNCFEPFMVIALLGILIAPYLQNDLFGNTVAVVVLVDVMLLALIAGFCFFRAILFTFYLLRQGISAHEIFLLHYYTLHKDLWHSLSRGANFIAKHVNQITVLEFSLSASKKTLWYFTQYDEIVERIADQLPSKSF